MLNLRAPVPAAAVESPRVDEFPLLLLSLFLSQMISIEDIILSHGTRGMDRIRVAIPAGYCGRAADLILYNKGRVLIGTGFPVGGS